MAMSQRREYQNSFSTIYSSPRVRESAPHATDYCTVDDNNVMLDTVGDDAEE